ncbi:MAG: VOC family protein [Lachnospiraceae bacterium]|nr:VOC family protein [Lachnospiraceae bacterium]
MENSKLFTGLQHIGVPTSDVDKTISFYETFGFEVEWSKGTAPEDKVAFLKCGSFVIETYYSEAPALANGAIDHMAMDVSDIDAAYEYAASKGYPSLEGKITFLPFFANGVKFFTIQGPNMEKLEFNQKL